MTESTEDLIRKRQLLTTEAKALNSTVTTETIVSVKGDNYLRIDDLFDQLPDLVNEQWKPWYCKHFNRLGAETVLRLAATARQESHTDRRHNFSTMLKREP